MPAGFDAPHMIPVPPPKPPARDRAPWATGGNIASQFGVAGTPIVSGFETDLAEYNSELQGRNAVTIYEQMRRGDGQVEATLNACELPVMSAKWEVNPPERSDLASAAKTSNTGAGKQTRAKAQEIADFVKENLFGGIEFQTSSGGWATQRWNSVIRNALLMLTFGCAAHEDVYRVDGDSIRVRELSDLPARTFYRWMVEDDGRTLKWLGQYGYRGAQFDEVSVPADKICVFTYRKEGANFYGRAILRAAYPHWYLKNRLYRIDSIACERNGMGVPDLMLPPGASAEDKEAALNFVTQLAVHEKTGVVRPAQSEFTLVGVKGTLRSVMPSIMHHNEQISVSALAMFLNLGRTSSGSRSLGDVHSKFFMLALQNVADQIAFDITRTTVRRLVAFNFGDDAPVPRLYAANVQARDIGEVIDALSKLAIAGVFVSDRPARNSLRTDLGFAQETSEGVVAIKAETITEGNDPNEVIDKGGAQAKGAKPQPQQMSERHPKVSRKQRTHLSPFWQPGHDPKLRMVSPSEAHLDFPAHQAEHERAQRQIGNLLSSAKPLLIRAYAEKMARALKAGEDPATVTFKPNTELRQKLSTETQRTYDFGYDQVQQERQRLLSQPRLVRLADVPKKKSRGLIAEIAASDVETDIANATRKSANDLRRADALEQMPAAQVADQLFSAVNDTGYVDDGIERAGREAARSAMASGRYDGLVQGKAQLASSGGFYERTGMLDDNECDNCEDHDGDKVPAVDGPPPPTTNDGVCEAGPLCRCEWFEVIA